MRQGLRGMETTEKMNKSPWMMDNLEEFRAFAGKKGEGVHLYQMPPPFQLVPAGPIILDTVRVEMK